MSKAERKLRKLRGRAEAKLIRGNAGRQTGEAKSRRKNASDESTVLEYSFTVSL